MQCRVGSVFERPFPDGQVFWVCNTEPREISRIPQFQSARILELTGDVWLSTMEQHFYRQITFLDSRLSGQRLQLFSSYYGLSTVAGDN